MHGYDHPWPAGGGANLIPDGTSTENGYIANKYLKADGSEENNNNYRISEFFPVTAEETYSLCIYPSANSAAGMCYYDSTKNYISGVDLSTASATGMVSLQVPSNAAYCRSSFSKADYAFKTLVCKGTSKPTAWTPYSNICPITGFDEVELWDDPAYGGLIEWNQYVKNGNFESTDNWRGVGADISISDGVCSLTLTGTVSNLGQRLDSYPYVSRLPNHVYLASIDVKVPKAVEAARLYATGDKYKSNITLAANTWTNIVAILKETSENNIGKTQFFVGYTADAGYVAGDICQFKNVNAFDLTKMFGSTKADEIYAMEQAEAGSGVAYFRSLFPDDYYPYNAGEVTTVGAVNGDPYRHYTVTFPSEAGTVYGAELTVNKDGTGRLVVDRAKVTLVSTDIFYPINNNGYTNIAYAGMGKKSDSIDKGKASTNVIVEFAEISTDKTNWDNESKVGKFFGGAAYTDYWVGFPYGTTLEEMRETLTGMSYVYKLSTPITYTLTASQVQTLLGTNHVWSDAGNVELSYWTHTS